MESSNVMTCTADVTSTPSPLSNGCLKPSSFNNGYIAINGDTMALKNDKINDENDVEHLPNNNYQANGSIVNGSPHESNTEEMSKTSPDTKIIFFEMMTQIIRYQLEIGCDQAENQRTAKKPNRVFPVLKDSQKRPYMLQPSLFPMMYPTVYFTDEDDVLSDVPSEVKPFLRWKMTSITANTMRSIVMRSGYKLMPLDRNPKNKTFNNWNAIWCKHLRVNEFQLIGYYQRVNHFPGSFNFGRKDHLWVNFKNKIEKFGADTFGNFHPPTFVLPHDYSALVSYWKSKDSISEPNNSEQPQSDDVEPNQKLFICKPPASARGQGIDIVSNLEELHALMSQHNVSNQNCNRKPKVSMVVQEYISNPCLLHNGAKFDLRVYVLITSILPLRLYVYEEGLVRFAANHYSKNISDIKNQFIHLTNYSVNKNCVEYVPSSSIDSQDGHKWTLKTLWKYLSMSRKVDTKKIWEQILDLVIKTVISAESNIITLVDQNLKNRRSCFELLGFDIMLDDNLKLWLLEVNITPSLRADSVLDFSVKNQLVQDILNTLGYQLSPRFRRHYNFGHLICPEKNDMLTHMRVPDCEKHKTYEELFITQGFDACQDLVDQLNDDDVIHLMESEDELSRCGKFRRVFPCSTGRDYLRYFNYCHYYNLLLIAWEERYWDRRETGIDRLCSYMLQKDSMKINVEKMKAQLNELNRIVGMLKQQT